MGHCLSDNLLPTRDVRCVLQTHMFNLKNKSLSIGILAKMKEGAENVHTKIQAKVESVGLKPSALDGKG